MIGMVILSKPGTSPLPEGNTKHLYYLIFLFINLPSLNDYLYTLLFIILWNKFSPRALQLSLAARLRGIAS